MLFFPGEVDVPMARTPRGNFALDERSVLDLWRERNGRSRPPAP